MWLQKDRLRYVIISKQCAIIDRPEDLFAYDSYLMRFTAKRLTSVRVFPREEEKKKIPLMRF